MKKTTRDYVGRRVVIRKRNSALELIVSVLFMIVIMWGMIQYTKEAIVRDIRVTQTESQYQVEFWGNIYAYNK